MRLGRFLDLLPRLNDDFLKLKVVLMLLTLALTLSSCQSKIRGGNAETKIGDKVLIVRQSDNPEQPTRQVYEEVITPVSLSTAPPGNDSVTVGKRVRIETELGSSQSLAGIIKAAEGKSRYIASGFVAVGLLIWAYFAYKNDWPLVSATLGIGAFITLLTGNYWMGVIGGVVGIALTIGYKLGIKPV